MNVFTRLCIYALLASEAKPDDDGVAGVVPAGDRVAAAETVNEPPNVPKPLAWPPNPVATGVLSLRLGSIR